MSSYAWLSALSDAPGAAYLQAEAEPPQNATLFRRQLALIEAEDGGCRCRCRSRSRSRAKLPPAAAAPAAYLFDVFRVSGGKVHTWCFHGPVSDDFQWNAANVKPVPDEKEGYGTETEGKYLSLFVLAGESRQAGDSPEVFQAEWAPRGTARRAPSSRCLE